MQNKLATKITVTIKFKLLYSLLIETLLMFVILPSHETMGSTLVLLAFSGVSLQANS